MGAPVSSEGKAGRRPGLRLALAVAVFLALADRSGASSGEADPEPAADPVLEAPLRHFSHIDASRSLVELLPLLAGLDEAERGTGRFLAGVAFSELRLDPAAERELSIALEDPRIGGAAAVALARVWSRTGRWRDLLALARETSLETLPVEDRGELAWRAARAAYATRRFRETAGWLARVPRESSFFPFGVYLRAQAAFADGRPDRAAELAATLVAGAPRANGVLRDRAAILLGDLHTEAGRYDDAVRALAVPRDDSPFAARASRDRLVAEGLARLAAGEFADATPVVERVGRYLDDLSDEVARAVATPQAVEDRVRELRGSWPPRFAVFARREWAAAHARRALDSPGRRAPGGLYGALVRLAGRDHDRHRAGADPWLPPRAPVTRFFYPPSGELDRLLQAVALLEEPVAYHGDACRLRAAVAIRQRVARWLLEEAGAPGRDELHALASVCGGEAGAPADLARATRVRIAQAVEAEAQAVRDRYRRDRLELELAIGSAWSRHLQVLDRAKREASSPDAGTPLARP